MRSNYCYKTFCFEFVILFGILGISKGLDIDENRIHSVSDDLSFNDKYKEVGCGNYQLDPSMSLRIQSPYFQYGYNPDNYECNWNFYGTQGCNPEINCDNFDLTESTDCSGDFLELSDGSDARTKFCGTNGPSVASSSSMLLAYFKTGGSESNDKGFRCSVSCAPPPQLRFGFPGIGNFLPTSPPKIADCLCGVPGTSENGSPPGRIVNGTVAEKYKWKWQVAIVLRGQDSPLCGGSLITDRHILTAAHCVVTTALAVFPAAAEIVLNDYDITASNDTATIRRNIISAIPHPQYNAATQDYDVAVLELSQPVNLTATSEPRVTPVCLPAKGNKNLFVGDIGTVTGWGTTTEGGDQPDVLMQVDVPVITNEECNKHYDNRITPRMLCAGYPDGGRDSCQGDSGGPFVLAGPDGRYTEIGIVSFGQGCARAGKEGVYARTTELNDWIRSNARGATWCKEQ